MEKTKKEAPLDFTGLLLGLGIMSSCFAHCRNQTLKPMKTFHLLSLLLPPVVSSLLSLT